MYNISESWSKPTMTDAVTGWAAWQYVVTILLGVIVYDQGKTHQI